MRPRPWVSITTSPVGSRLRRAWLDAMRHACRRAHSARLPRMTSMRRVVLAGLVVLALASSITAHRRAGQPQPARQARPNILFLFADDMRADTIAAHGNPHIRTPHLDRLVQNGFSFRRAYVLGGDSGAVCVASRAMLMSGRTLFNVDTKTLGGVTLLPETLGRHGYTTFGTGKWHNGEASWLRAF